MLMVKQTQAMYTRLLLIFLRKRIIGLGSVNGGLCVCWGEV